MSCQWSDLYLVLREQVGAVEAEQQLVSEVDVPHVGA